MNKSKKIAFVLLIALVTVLTLSAFVGSVKAQGSVNLQASMSTNNKGVGNDATDTFIINNTGTATVANINVTIPDGTGGYTNLRNFAIVQQPSSQIWTIGRIDNFIVLNSSSTGLSTGQSITFSLDAKNPSAAGNYKWTVDGNVTVTSSVSISNLLAALTIFGIAAGIAFLNTGLNRVLINYFVGWEQYRVMQKEMNEYRTETMAAARAKDKKQMEKLKKRQSQVNAMQAKMIKPQMVQFGISFLYIFVWFFVLTPTFGNTSWFTCRALVHSASFTGIQSARSSLGCCASRIMGIMPIEP